MVVSHILESLRSSCQNDEIDHDYVDPHICSQAGVRNICNRYIYEIKVLQYLSKRSTSAFCIRTHGLLILCLTPLARLFDVYKPTTSKQYKVHGGTTDLPVQGDAHRCLPQNIIHIVTACLSAHVNVTCRIRKNVTR